MAADASSGSSTIKLRNGTYKLTIDGVNKDASATGDLDLSGNITIKGSGSRGTIIDGNNLDRVIHVLQGNVKISGVTIEHGLASMGGGLLNTGGQVSLSSVVVANNRAVGAETAKESLAAAVVSGAPGNNGRDGTAGMGGGIYNGAGSLSISNSTISGNQAQGSGGGRGSDGESARGVSIAGKNVPDATGGIGGKGGAGAAAFGGGIYNAKGASLVLSGTIISSNIALGGRGGQGGTGGVGTGADTGAVTKSPPTPGGNGTGGVGGAGGAGGVAEGGGLFNLGAVQMQGTTNTFKRNIAAGGAGGTGGVGGAGIGGAGGNSVAGTQR